MHIISAFHKLPLHFSFSADDIPIPCFPANRNSGARKLPILCLSEQLALESQGKCESISWGQRENVITFDQYGEEHAVGRSTFKHEFRSGPASRLSVQKIIFCCERPTELGSYMHRSHRILGGRIVVINANA